jgi:OmcA/MtrC family decaheme c-type cytochrome
VKRILLSRIWSVRLGAVLLLVAGSVYLVSADGPDFTAQDKAYYADANLVAFVRPGLVFKILSAEIGADGTIKTRFTINDPQGLPLDRDGVYTPGTVGTSFIAAYIPKGKTQYVSYTTRTQVSPITGVSAKQAGTDSGGTYQVNAIGDYTYTFKTKAPAGYDRSATHTIGLYGSRNLTEFELSIYPYDLTYNFVPDGSAVEDTRDVIRTVTCNKCHQDLSAHGTGGRKSMQVCVLCHTPQTSDPDTGNTVDMAVMIHKIHRGEDLPSVTAGTPYVIIGNSQSVHDFSNVVFPAVDTRNCTFCHEQSTGAAQATAYLIPNMPACNSCHDNVHFDTGENHAGLVQNSSEHCAECHIPQGEAEFDLSVTGAHTIPTFSSELPGTTFNLISVTGAAGQPPTVVFKITDKADNPILPSQMNSLSLIFAGPTTDYPAPFRENARGATVAADGSATYTFKTAIPAGSKGSFGMGIEGYRNITIAAGTDHEQTVRDAGINKVAYFSVDGSTVKPRRTVAATANCNQCHSFLSLHGGNRNQIEQCVLCHTPNATDAAQRPTSELPAQGIDLVTMIHRIHTGEELGFDYTIYGFGGSANNFSEVRFSGDRRNCTACHVNNSQQLPVSPGHLDVADPRGYLNPEGPETAACTSCHTAIFDASHALANTTRLGESCAACHGQNSDFSVNKVHAH